MNYLKEPTHHSEAWRKAVAKLACVRCYRKGMTQAAHRNQGKGLALKVDDCWTAALCVECHAEIDQGKTMSKEERRQAMDTYILLTIRQLARDGALKV